MPPNIIIFNPDQWRGDVLGHMGNPAARTPVLDELVRTDAISFSNAFCQNPVCVPSRCSFMTGLYPQNRGHRTMYHMLHPEQGERNLLQVLRENGYYTWWAGKNDLFDGPSTDGGASAVDERCWATEDDFKRWGGRCAVNPHADQSWRSEKGAEDFYSMQCGELKAPDGEPFLDFDWGCVLKAKEFLEARESDQPFCMFLSLGYPHPPYAVEEPFFSAIDREALPERTRPPEDWEGKPAILKAIHERQGLGDWDESNWDELRATYYGSCMRVDQQFGLLIDALKAAGKYEDTAIFFFSDHGDFTGDYDLVEKNQNTFEDCLTRVPFVLKPPASYQLKPGLRESALVELIDMSATVYELAGVDPAYDHFGHSLVPLLEEDGAGKRDAAFCVGGRRPGEEQASEGAGKDAHDSNGLYWPRVGLQVMEEPFVHNHAVMCRTLEWKYVHRLGEDDELYDLINDPEECYNRIADPDCSAVLNDLRLKLLEWSVSTADVVPRKLDSR